MESALSHKRMGHSVRDADLRPAKKGCRRLPDLAAFHLPSTVAGLDPVLVVRQDLFAGSPRSNAGACHTIYPRGAGANRSEGGRGAGVVAGASLHSGVGTAAG